LITWPQSPHLWSYETKLRIVTVELGLEEHELDTPVTIPLRDRLKAVTFGDVHPAPRVVADGHRQCAWPHFA
jgi:hypothetical protein